MGLLLVSLYLAALRGRRTAPAAGPRSAFWYAPRLVLGGLLALLLAASLSCGGGSNGGGTSAGPEAGTVTITGTSGTTSHAAQIAVSVS